MHVPNIGIYPFQPWFPGIAMNDQENVDTGSLERRARGLEQREAITTVLEAPDIRIIVGSRVSDDGSATSFIEVASFLDEHLLDAYDDMMARRQRLDKALGALGFSSYDDDLDRIWEMVCSDERLTADLARVRRVVESAFRPDLLDPFGQ